MSTVLHLPVCVFDGGWNLPLWAAIEQGFFEHRGLAVELTLTPSSRAMMQGFAEGQYPLILVSADNVVAYQQNLAEVPVPGEPDAVIVLGGDAGFLSLVAAPGIRTLDDLRGRVLAVDAPDTGFALVLYELLARAGLPQASLCIEPQGSTEQRYQALLGGRCAATLLRTPYELLAARQGCRVLARSADALPHYQGTVGATRQAWAEQHPAELKAFLQGYRQGLAWCRREPAAACALLQAHVPGLDPALARAAYGLLLDPVHGLTPDLAVDRHGMQAVAALRRRYLPATAGRQERMQYRASW